MDWLRSTDFAHRGLHGIGGQCPENSLPAIEEAIGHGYGVEIDVQRSADFEAIVFHDLSLKRLTGDMKLVASLHSRTLKKTRICGTSARISTLKDVLDLVRGRVPLLLEIKSAPGIPGMLEKRVAELARRYRGPLAVMSWAPGTVEALSLLAPNLPAGRIVSKFANPKVPGHFRWFQGTFWPAFDSDASKARRFVACELKSLLSQQMSEDRKDDTPLLTWTVKSNQEAHRARDLADAIIFEGFKP